jgi:surface antigen Omp85-like protein
VLTRENIRFRWQMAALFLFLAMLWFPAWCVAASEARPLGWRWTAVPLINFSSDDGAGYGVRVNGFQYDGTSIPYRSKHSAQIFATTRGKWVHRLLVDRPQFRPGQRLEVEAVYEKDDFANYYGELRDAAVAAHTRDQRTFRQAFPELSIKWIRDLRAAWRLRVGGRVSRNDIRPNADEGSILVSLAPLGATGGTLFQGHGAVRYDTRDNYNDTSQGVLEEFLVEYGLGGGGEFHGATVSYDHRHFRPVLGELVLAHRARIDWTLGDLPFYEELAMGGSSTVRGLPKSRERGEARVLLSGELRWRGMRLWRREWLHLGMLLFGDVGQIFARDAMPAGDRWRRGGGIGARLHWHSTIVRADYGLSGARRALYVTFAQVF